MIRCYVLLGGFVGSDGPVVSPGMIALAFGMNSISGVSCSWHCWSTYPRVIFDIASLPNHTSIALIGYSGGGTRAIFIANAVSPRPVKLLVLYDPSPKWQMCRIGNNVERAICYWNRSPRFFRFGGGKLESAEITEIAENHAIVQFDLRLHRMTVQAISEAI